jgi:hypothetical protein
MISEQLAQEIDVLEQALVLHGVSIDDLRRHYAKFLLQLISDGSFNDIPKEILEKTVSCLNVAAAHEKINKEDCMMKMLISELWEIEELRAESDAASSKLARCVILCFGTQEGWLEMDSGEATPLDFYLFTLIRCLPQIARQYMVFFRKLLNPRVEMGEPL